MQVGDLVEVLVGEFKGKQGIIVEFLHKPQDQLTKSHVAMVYIGTVGYRIRLDSLRLVECSS